MATAGDGADLVNLPDDTKALISGKEGKNAKAVRCQRCSSLILKALSVTFVHSDVSWHQVLVSLFCISKLASEYGNSIDWTLTIARPYSKIVKYDRIVVDTITKEPHEICN